MAEQHEPAKIEDTYPQNADPYIFGNGEHRVCNQHDHRCHFHGHPNWSDHENSGPNEIADVCGFHHSSHGFDGRLPSVATKAAGTEAGLSVARSRMSYCLAWWRRTRNIGMDERAIRVSEVCELRPDPAKNHRVLSNSSIGRPIAANWSHNNLNLLRA